MTPADIEKTKELLPTSLGSDEIRQNLAADILRRSVFSARMSSASYLAKVREVCALLSAGEISQADARNRLEAVLDQLGYSMSDGGGIKNPASIRRLNLILDTQRQMAASVATLMNEDDVSRYGWPAWELTRIERREIPRVDWQRRWRAASAAVNDEGVAKGTQRMVALKSSPVWTALGNGEGGFTDVLRNPYPPFAYSSGLGWLPVDREECERLGLIKGSQRPTPDGEQHPSIAPSKMSLADAVRRYGIPEIAEGLA